MRLSGWLSAYAWASTSVSDINAAAEHHLMPAACSFVCKQAPGKTAQHHALNDVVARAFSAAGIPVSKEPAGLSRTDGKRPDGMILISWRASQLSGT